MYFEYAEVIRDFMAGASVGRAGEMVVVGVRFNILNLYGGQRVGI